MMIDFLIYDCFTPAVSDDQASFFPPLLYILGFCSLSPVFSLKASSFLFALDFDRACFILYQITIRHHRRTSISSERASLPDGCILAAGYICIQSFFLLERVIILYIFTFS